MAETASTTSLFAVEQAGKLLTDLNSQIRRAAKSPNADAVHDIRVDIRKISQALRVFKPVFPGQERKKFRRKLKRIMELAGEVRNFDIALKLLKKSKSNAAQPLQSTFKKRRKRAARAFAKALRRWIDQRLPSEWRSRLLAPAKNNQTDEPVTNVADQVIRSMTKDYYAQGNEAAKVFAPKKLHKFRIASKKLRYTLELFQPVLPANPNGRLKQVELKQVENVQRLLGRANDYATTRRLILQEGASKKLAAQLKKKERKRVEEFHCYWENELAKPQPYQLVKRSAPAVVA